MADWEGVLNQINADDSWKPNHSTKYWTPEFGFRDYSAAEGQPDIDDSQFRAILVRALADRMATEVKTETMMDTDGVIWKRDVWWDNAGVKHRGEKVKVFTTNPLLRKAPK